ncbi:hypothetical protein DFH09DRAFT_1099263 [Mycena vulgaris]|nr:hypothetical protein DFH09DRAFT_1099263 [Mycena vulgaris]
MYLDARRFEKGWGIASAGTTIPILIQMCLYGTWSRDSDSIQIRSCGRRSRARVRALNRDRRGFETWGCAREDLHTCACMGSEGPGLGCDGRRKRAVRIRRARTSAEGRDRMGNGARRGGDAAAAAGSAQGWVDRGRAGCTGHGRVVGADAAEGDGGGWDGDGGLRHGHGHGPEGGTEGGESGRSEGREGGEEDCAVRGGREGEGEGEGEGRRTRADEEEWREGMRRRGVKGEHTRMIKMRRGGEGDAAKRGGTGA